MEKYNVFTTPDADNDVDRCHNYLLEHFQSDQAGDAFLDDFDETVDELSLVAGKLQVGTSKIMKMRNLRRINFRRHDYFMIYRINGNDAEIIAVAHFKEDLHRILVQRGD